MNASSIFSPGDNSTRITLSGTFRLITEPPLPFLWCPQIMFSAPQYLVFPAGCSQRNVPDCTLGLITYLHKMVTDCLPVNSSRHSSRVTSKLKSRCPPIVRLMPNNDPVQRSMLCGDLARPF
ncbi:hypothetical protein TNCV_1422121 [Trichonephila clavipes]|nr:hypothetical protein TNCV_1422121 [Trichonephila clavipes]